MKSNAFKNVLIIAGIILFAVVVSFLTVKGVHYLHVRSSPDIAGAWEGTVSIPSMKQRVVLKISGTKPDYTATLDHVDMGMRDVPVKKLVYYYPSVKVELNGGILDARVNSGATEISGNFKQGKSSIHIILNRTTTPDTIATALKENDYAPRKGSDVQGLWKGTLDAGQLILRLSFKIAEQADGTLRVDMDSTDQGLNGLPATSASYTRPTLTFEYDGMKGSYQGQVNGRKIEGTWKQAGREFPLTLEQANPEAEQSPEADKSFGHKSDAELQGHWKGVLNVQKTKLHLLLDIAKLSDGTYWGSLTSPDQSPVVIPATSLEFNAPKIQVEWKGFAARFTGELKDGKLSGQWQQGGGRLPVVFERN